MNQSKARVIKANRLLQSKVGIGHIDNKTINKCQNIIDNTGLNFSDMARDLLQKIKTATKDAQKFTESNDDQQLIDNLAGIVMQIKGQAGMFGFKRAGDLADTMLTFLESIDSLDKHVIEIVQVHTKTLEIIFNNNMTGDGGEFGAQLHKELEDACKRYFTKFAKGEKFAPKDEGDIFFVG